MIIALPYYDGDRELAQKLLDFIKELEPDFAYPFLIIRDSDCQPIRIPDGFNHREVIYSAVPIPAGCERWPFVPNRVFNQAMTEVSYVDKQPFLWLEPDAVPIKAGWMKQLELQYIGANKPYMGEKVDVKDVPLHMSGVGIYPANMKMTQAGGAALSRTVAWDVAGADFIIPQAHFTTLIKHNWRHEAIDTPAKLDNLMGQRPEMVLFHSDKSGCMIDQLGNLRRGGSNAGNIGAEAGSTTKGFEVSQGDASPPPPPPPLSGGLNARNIGTVKVENPVSSPAPAQLTCDIFIKTYPPDYPWLQLCLESIGRFCSGFGQVIVIAPNDRAPVGAREKLIVRTDHQIMDLVNPKDEPDGYLAQQVQKLYADLESQADYILHVDSDVLFTRPTKPEDFFRDGKVIWYMTPYEKTQTPWKPITEKFLMEPVEYEFMRRAPQMIPRWLYPRLREWTYVKHLVPLGTYIRNQPYRSFSEFNAIGAYAYRHYRDQFYWINTEEETLPEPVARQFRSWDGVNPYRNEIETILPSPRLPTTGYKEEAATVTPESKEVAPSLEVSEDKDRIPARQISSKPKRKRRRMRRGWTPEMKAKLRAVALARWEKVKAENPGAKRLEKERAPAK